MILRRLATLSILALSTGATAETVTVAVASNFADTASELAREFEASTRHEVQLIRGSSGKLFAQIVNGAPVDVFMSADVELPRQIGLRGLAESDSHFTYAFGELVIWSRDPTFAGKDCMQSLSSNEARRIAIANPLHAPYGVAAKQYLEGMGLWQDLESRLVYGENIAQTLQFVATGNANIGFVAQSQLKSGRLPEASCMTTVSELAHSPIEQAAIRLSRANNNKAALAFVSFLSNEAAAATIRRNGYRLPADRGSQP